MGTKNEPGKFDYYADAEPDEPMFVLLGRDRHAAKVVRYWATLRMMESLDGVEPNKAKIQEALDCAEDMEFFRMGFSKEDPPEQA